MPSLDKLAKVNESISINRYDNGWMVEVGGRDHDDQWSSAKIICNTQEEVLDLIKQYNATPLDN